ncbi:LOW QUALITY PROTEIN: hypothetical protein ACHAW6_012737 [Cyclotella cf. meneghiniana]
MSENEMLSIVTTLDEFCSMLLLQTYKCSPIMKIDTEWVLSWHNKIEGFFAWLHYIEASKNTLVDHFYRLHHLPMMLQIVEEVVELNAVSGDEDKKSLFLKIENILVFFMITSMSYFCLTSICQISLTQHTTHEALLAYMNSSSKPTTFGSTSKVYRSVFVQVSR